MPFKKRIALIIASGQSLTQEDIDYTKGKVNTTIAISDNYKKAPWANYLYSCDDSWWKHYYKDVMSSGFLGTLVTVSGQAAGRHENVNYFRGAWNKLIDEQAGVLSYGHNSGTQAIGLAVALGYNKIILLGFDMKGKHWFGNHPIQLNRALSFDKCIAYLESNKQHLLDLGVEVINCSRDTDITAFPIKPITEVL